MTITNPDIYKGNIIMSRVRLARNLKGYPFRTENPVVAKEIVKKVNRALVRTDTFDLFYMANLSELKLEAMKERHLISQNLIDNHDCGAALINKDESISVMINEEDVIREQCFMRGLSLSEAYKRLDHLDDDLAKNLDIAFDERFGYLTACPTNLGTGLRASVLLFLPALTESGRISALVKEMKKLGLTVRGLYGEGSDSEGYMYQISNEVTLGVSEYDIINQVEQTVEAICIAEREQMERLFVKDELKTMDRAKKSFGVLTNAVMLGYNEFLSHVALVKLGAMLGLIGINNIESIDDLIIRVRPANICEQYGRRLSAIDRDLFRAEMVGNQLLKLKE
ncbi:MAG: ATP--guanido phosphotransferase [Clostridiales bacterium]|nr:ATP--guanido phosphotransferase [Clostridiales bacterium]